MGEDVTVCALCSQPFDDVKSAIQCVSCAVYFHGKYQDVEMRGFHLQKATWKCKKCIIKSEDKKDCGGGRKFSAVEEDMIDHL